MSMETEQRHLQMLLTVSSFGESLRWLRKRSAEAFFKGGLMKSEFYFFGIEIGSITTGRTIKKELPFPTADSTQIRP